MKTVSFNSQNVDRQWHLVDLEGVTLGRAAARIASVLRGKNKPQFTPHADCGDFVVVINADKVKLTGTKPQKKLYRRHSGYLGSLREMTAAQMLDSRPERVVELAVKGMLPKGPLGRRMFKKLKVYTGTEHPHAAQKPELLDLNC